MDSHAHTIHIPLAPVMAASIVCETMFGLVNAEAPLHRRRLEFFTKNLIFDTRRSEQALDFKPHINFAEGCRRTAEWYRSQGLVN